MTQTAPAASAPTGPATPGPDHRRAGAVPTPANVITKNRRRPAWVALGVAFLALCMVGGWAAFNAVTTTVPVVGVSKSIVRGQVIDRTSLTTVQVAADPALRTIPADQLETVVGKRAATDLPAGGILPVGSFTDDLLPAKQHSIVGVLVKDGGAPLTGLTTGAAVRLIPLPAQQGAAAAGKTAVTPGIVVATSATEDGTGTRVDVDVTNPDAAGLQLLAAQNRIALVVDSQEK